MTDSFDTRILQALHQRVTEEIAIKKETLCAGNAQDIATYKGLVGEIRGLGGALRIAKDIEDDARGVKRGEKT